MRSLILVLLLLNALFLSAQEATNNNLSFDNSLRTESEKLLTEWMDTFLTYHLLYYGRRRPNHTADIGIRQRLFPCGSTSPVWVCLKFRACLF